MTAQLALDYRVERFALASPFRISGHVFTESRIVVVTVSDGVHSGRGEAAGVYYLGDDILAMTAAIDGVRSAVTAGITRDELQRLLPAGGHMDRGGAKGASARQPVRVPRTGEAQRPGRRRGSRTFVT